MIGDLTDDERIFLRSLPHVITHVPPGGKKPLGWAKQRCFLESLMRRGLVRVHVRGGENGTGPSADVVRTDLAERRLAGEVFEAEADRAGDGCGVCRAEPSAVRRWQAAGLSRCPACRRNVAPPARR